MNTKMRHIDIGRLDLLAGALIIACATASGAAFAKPEPAECIALGALVYDDWTRVDAGGSGLPAGEDNVEYLRCNSCHGWDRLGEFGGYVRRERTADQPNAGLGDPNTVSRFIAPGLGNFYHVSVTQVLHEGTGRAYEDGSGSWVELPANPTPEQLAAHAAGYTLGNLHPDFSAAGVNGDDLRLTQDQLECVVDFINFGDADPKYYFQEVDQYADPVRYVINSGASATAGRSFYEERCLSCHGEPDQNLNGAFADDMATWMRQDGAYSEFVHKARWGIPDTAMTRAALGEPTSQNMIDVMLYLQEYVADNTAFDITTGITGSWYLPERSGEGFQLEVAPTDVEDQWQLVTSYYTYDGFGNQVWLIGNGPVVGGSATVPVWITSGGVFGTLFDHNLVEDEPWGQLEFSFSGCRAGHVKVVPNADMIDLAVGFETFEFDIERLTTPVHCP